VRRHRERLDSTPLIDLVAFEQEDRLKFFHRGVMDLRVSFP